MVEEILENFRPFTLPEMELNPQVLAVAVESLNHV